MSDDKRTMTPEQWRDTKDTGPANSLADPDAALGRGTQMNDSNNAATAATTTTNCPKCGSGFHYYRACNEGGWRCCECEHRPGEPPGFDPSLDRELICSKVGGLLLDLHEHDYIYCSNSEHGAAAGAYAAERCRETGLFDQYSIIGFIFEGQKQHGEYWKKISEGILAGNDARSRCPGGRLARMWSGDRSECLQADCVCGDPS